jgi:hypothetical protein
MIWQIRAKFCKQLPKNNCKKWLRIEIKIYLKSTQNIEEKYKTDEVFLSRK